MKRKYCRVFVTNIKSDEIIQDIILLHKVICDCTIEGTDNTEKEVCRIFSIKEYGNVLKYGFYYIEDLDMEVL